MLRDEDNGNRMELNSQWRLWVSISRKEETNENIASNNKLSQHQKIFF